MRPLLTFKVIVMKALKLYTKIGLALMILFSLGISLNSCSEKNGVDYLTAVIGHGGFDFSAGISDTTNWENNDGDVISWYPNSGNHPMYPNNAGYLWFRNDNVSSDYQTRTVDLGEVELNSVTAIPASWDTLPPPMLPGHVMVVKCKDGYAKFKVNSIDEQAWTANVDYVFTSGNEF
jgi:hypothetical protein